MLQQEHFRQQNLQKQQQQQQQILRQQQQQQQQQIQFEDQQDDELMDDEEIGYAILELGNDVLKILGVDAPVDDIGVFFSDAFYLQYFDAAFPDLDFSELQPGDTDEAVGENIQALIDLLAEDIMRGADLSHVSGLEIAMGNPDHCLELLQIIHQLTLMMAENGGTSGGDQSSPGSNGGQEMGPEETSPESGGQMQPANNMDEEEMVDDEYDDEEDDDQQDVMAQRLSPLHSNLKQAAAQQLSKEAEEIEDMQDYGFDEEDDDDKQEELQQEDEDEDDDDYYDELIKRGQKLHSNLATKTEQQQPVVGISIKDQEDEEDEYQDDFHNDDFSEEQSVQTSSEKKKQPVKQPSPLHISESSASQQQSPKMIPVKAAPVKANISASSENNNFNDYGDEEDYDDEEEEEEEEKPRPKVEFGNFKKAEPKQQTQEEVLYSGTAKKEDTMEFISSAKMPWVPKSVNVAVKATVQTFINTSIPEKQTSNVVDTLNSHTSNSPLDMLVESSSKQSSPVPQKEQSPPSKVSSVRNVVQIRQEIIKEEVVVNISKIAQEKQVVVVQRQQTPSPMPRIEEIPLVAINPLANLENMDYESKMILLQQLLLEYDRTPAGEFPFPRNVINDFIFKSEKDHYSLVNVQIPTNKKQERQKSAEKEKSQVIRESSRKRRPQTAKPQKELNSNKKLQNSAGLSQLDMKQKRQKKSQPKQKSMQAKQENGAIMSDDQLNLMSGQELKQLIKDQQQMLWEHERKLKLIKERGGYGNKPTIKKQQIAISSMVNLNASSSRKTPKYTHTMKPIKSTNYKPKSSRSVSKKSFRQYDPHMLKSIEQLDGGLKSNMTLSPYKSGTHYSSHLQNSAEKQQTGHYSQERAQSVELRAKSPQSQQQNLNNSSIMHSITKMENTHNRSQKQQIDSNSVNTDLTYGQLSQLVKVAETLPRDQQNMLVKVLKDKTSKKQQKQGQQNYQHLYSMLMNTFQLAKQNIKQKFNSPQKNVNKGEEGERMTQQQKQVELLLKEAEQERKNQERKIVSDSFKDKRLERDEKINALRDKRLIDQMNLEQKRSERARKDHHMKVKSYFVQMAKDIEKHRLQEQREAKKEQKIVESQQNGPNKTYQAVFAIESLITNQVRLLKEKVDNEQYERKIAEKAQIQEMHRMQRQIKEERKEAVMRYEEAERRALVEAARIGSKKAK